MFPQRIRKIFDSYKYFLLIFVTVSIFFYPVFRGNIPFPGDLLVSFYEPYRAYPLDGYAPGSVPSKDQGADVARHIFPWKKFTIDTLKNGQIPFWDPYNFSGNPLMANFQSAVFYPGNIVFFALPFNLAWTVYIFLSPFLAAFFMYLFLKEIELTNVASFFGAITFAFCSYMVVWMEYGNINHTFLWLPLALLFADRIIREEKINNNLFLIFVLLASVLAGYIQGFFYINGVIFFYFILKSLLIKSLSYKKIIIFSITLVFPVLLSLFQILPTNELFENSTRTNYTLSQIQHLLNPWWYAVTVVVPNFFGNPASHNHWFWGTFIERVSYIGLIPFILFIYALLNFKKKKEVVIFGILSVLVFLITLDLYITKYIYLIPVSVISTTVPTRMLSVFQFSAIVLSAIGLDFLIQKYNKKTLIMSLAFVGSVISICWVFAFIGSSAFHIDSLNIAISKKNLILPTIIFVLFCIFSFAFLKKIKLALFLIIVLSMLDLFYFFNRITPFVPARFIYPQTPIISFLQNNAGINRFWGYGSGYIESNFQTFDKTFSPEGVDPVHIRRYANLLESAKNGKLAKDLPRPDANIPSGFGSTDLRDNKYRQRLLDLLGVKYVLHKSKEIYPDYAIFPDGIYKFVYSDGYYQAYENKEVLPRVFLASDYVVEPDKQKIIDKLFDPHFDIHKTLILEGKPKMEFRGNSSDKLMIKEYTPNKISIEANIKNNNLLFISDNYSTQWEAMIDGGIVPIYRADFSFRAVEVPAGNHKIEFVYKGSVFYTGLKISFSTFLVLMILFIFYRRYEKK